MTPDENAKELIDDQLKMLKGGMAKQKLMQDLLYPSRQKEKDIEQINRKIEEYKKILAEAEKYTRKLKEYINFIGDQNLLCASYLILGKVLDTFGAIFELAKQGYSYEISELVRSANEGIFLILSFTLSAEKGDYKDLKKWLSGKIVQHSETRETIAKATENEATQRNEPIPFNLEEMMKHVYSSMSKYNHISYVGLITEKVDNFNQDLDFNKYAGFHFTLENTHMIDSTLGMVFVSLKIIYLKLKDEDSFDKLDAIYKTIPMNSTAEERKESMEEFKK